MTGSIGEVRGKKGKTKSASDDNNVSIVGHEELRMGGNDL